MSEEFLKSIKLISVDLTRQEKKIARVVLSDPEKVQTMTILELAKKAKVGTATISRFAKHVGCVDFADFKSYLTTSNLIQAKRMSEGSILDEVITYYKQSLEETKSLISLSQLKKITRIIRKANRVYILGVGSSGYNALELNQRLMRMGINSCAVCDSSMMSIIDTIISPKDTILAFSVSGNTLEICDAVQKCREKGVVITSITAFSNSVLAKRSNNILLIKNTEKSPNYNFMNSQFTINYIIDPLTEILLEHPTYLKNMNKTVEEVLRIKEANKKQL